MTEHLWPEHHDADDAGDAFDPHPDPHPDPLADTLADAGDDLPGDDPWDTPADPGHHQPEHELPDPGQPAYDDPAPVTDHGPPVGADPDAIAEPGDTTPVFPPTLDVGPLPEPVDGFPWTDPRTLGAAEPSATDTAAEPTPQDLATHAAADLPPGVDPWTALRASDDPATAALARFYQPGDTTDG